MLEPSQSCREYDRLSSARATRNTDASRQRFQVNSLPSIVSANFRRPAVCQTIVICKLSMWKDRVIIRPIQRPYNDGISFVSHLL